MGLLQAVIDDSGRGQPPHLVLAGCILDVERWIAFTDRWQTILDETPKIDYFKMNEANRLEGEFAKFSEAERDRKLWKFISALLWQQPHAVRVLIDATAYEKHFKGQISREMDYPTFGGLLEVISAVVRAQVAGTISDDAAVKFVFDEQGKESDMFLYLWAALNDPEFPTPPHDARLMPTRPAFKNDKTFLPLQAADLLAWHYRWAKVNEGKSVSNPFWDALKTIPCIESDLDELRLINMLVGTKLHAAKEGVMFEVELPKKYRKLARKEIKERKDLGRNGIDTKIV